MCVFGTRPEAIKMCPLVQELKRRSGFKTVVCVTGQHREMLKQVLQVFQIEPEHDLSVMREEQDLFDITTSVLNGMKQVLEEERPDIVLVHGDTSTTFAAALACFYLHIPIGHVEAGLRTYDLNAPYPEEMNREFVGLVGSVHFAPTEGARQNLLREGRSPESIFVTGNTVIDALHYTVRADYTHPELTWAADSRLVLLTVHRRENQGEPMRRIFRVIRAVVDEHLDVKVIYPVHLNPAVRAMAREMLGGHPRIHMIEPLNVIDFHNFMSRCCMVLSDSGGVQEEAPAFGKPVLVLRDTTERPEGVEAGTLRLVGTQEQEIHDRFSELLDDPQKYQAMSCARNPYGDGTASIRIADALMKLPL